MRIAVCVSELHPQFGSLRIVVPRCCHSASKFLATKMRCCVGLIFEAWYDSAGTWMQSRYRYTNRQVALPLSTNQHPSHIGAAAITIFAVGTEPGATSADDALKQNSINTGSTQCYDA